MSRTMTARGRLAQVLLVEDSDDDAELLKIGLAQAGFTGHMHHVTDGIECLAFLRKQGAFVGAPSPDLVVQGLPSQEQPPLTHSPEPRHPGYPG